MNTTPITLSHNQVIRVAGFNRYAQRITVGTVEGYATKNGDNPAESVKRATDNGHQLAWTMQDAAVLTADYAGKQARLDAERAEIAAAVEIHQGQPVIIEGRCYTVYVMGQQYSDPVAFIPNTQPL
jgi:hypothetical protein